MASEPKRMYECSACNKLHEHHHRAEECCAPEVETVWLCPVCDEPHYEKSEAEDCCAIAREGHEDSIHCPDCLRDHTGNPLQQSAVVVAGHCATCNPFFTPEQQLAVEDLVLEVTGKHECLNA